MPATAPLWGERGAGGDGAHPERPHDRIRNRAVTRAHLGGHAARDPLAEAAEALGDGGRVHEAAAHPGRGVVLQSPHQPLPGWATCHVGAAEGRVDPRQALQPAALGEKGLEEAPRLKKEEGGGGGGA